MVTPTEKAKRSEALYYDNHNITRRTLCDRVVNLESDIEEIKNENARLKKLLHKLRTEAETCHDEGDSTDFCCSECGMRMFTETNDTYTMIAADERTIIKRPNYCPSCGRKVMDE